MRLHRFLLASLLAVPLSLTLPFALSGQTNLPAAGNIATFAGTGGYRSGADAGDNTAAISVSLQTPDGLAFDKDGNLYIADKNDNRIRMVDTAGNITTVAGNGTPGNTGDGDLATLATLFQPIGVTVDANGDLLIVDYGNHRIRKVDHVTHFISPFAGNGTNGYAGDDLPANDPSVELNDPSAVAVDGDGNVYIADLSNYRIRIVDNTPLHTITPLQVMARKALAGMAFQSQMRAWNYIALRRWRLTGSATFTLRISITIAFAKSTTLLRTLSLRLPVMAPYPPAPTIPPPSSAMVARLRVPSSTVRLD